MTAKEAGKRFGKSPRTIRRLVAQDRPDYEATAAARRQQAHDLKQQGMTWALRPAAGPGCSPASTCG